MAKNIVNLSLDGSNYTTRPFGTCETAAATTAKVVTCADFSLTTGATVLVKFTYANSASSPTLNVNSTGAKSIYYRGAALASSLYYWGAGDVVEFYYNGTQWDLLNVSNTNTTYSSLSASDATTGTSTTGRLITAKVLHDKITAMLPSVPTISVTQTATSGNEVGKVTINGSDTTLYAPVQTTVSGNAGSATKLATARTIDGVSFDGSANITHYGECSTAASTAAKTVALTGFALATGARVAVKFTVTNTASSPTLNVNSTGAKSIMYRGSAISAGYLASNRVYEFVYDGTDYELIGDINTDSDTTYGGDRGISLSSGKFGHSNAAITAKTAYVDTDADASISVATNGGSFKVTDVIYDAYGHITGSQDRTITLSESKKGTVTSITLTQGDGITVSSSGSAITSSGSRTISLNTATTDVIGGIKIAKDNSSYEVTANTSPTISADVSGDKYYAVEIDKNDKAYVYVPWTDTNTNTQNTAGAGNKVDTKMFLVGRTAQSTGTSYSNVNVYIGTDNCLYSNGTKVSVEGHTHDYLSSLPTHTHSYTELTGSGTTSNQAIVSSGTANGWKLLTLGDAAQKGVATSVASGGTGLVTSGAVYTAIANSFAANDAMIFKGTLGTNGTATSLPATHNAGWTYRVITAGTYAGVNCEIGDLVICITDGTSANNAHWTVAQTNIDGAVTGPTSSIDGNIVVFNGTGGKSIKDSGKTIANLTYSAGTGLSLSTSNAFSLATSGVTKGTYGPSAAVTGSDGSTISVPQITVDEYGRVTSVVNRTYTSKNTTYEAENGIVLSSGKFGLEASGVTVNSDGTAKTYGNTSQQTPSHGGTFNIPYYTVDSYGRITSAGTTTVKLPNSENTDKKVVQTASTENNSYYLLASASTSPSSGTAYQSIYSTGISINPSTNTITASNFNGNASSSTYATNARVTATTSAGTYYPTWTSGTTADTDYVLRGNSNFKYVIVAGTTSAEGFDSIYLGNSKATGTAGNSTGRILLYSSSSSYHTLVGAATSSTIAHTLPATAGTILNTGTTSISRSYTSGTKIATVTINSVGTDIYIPAYPTIPSITITDTDSGTFITDITSSNHTITVSRSTALGSTTKPIYLGTNGVVAECSTYAGGTKVTLNGSNKGASTASFYAPTAVGTTGQVLVSAGSGAPAWKDFSTVDLKVSSDIASISKTITTSWAELVSATNMASYCTATGTYVVQVSGSGIGTSSGIFSWSSGGTTEDEILLHRSGATTNIYLRLKNSALQIAGAAAISTAFAITVKVKRLI